MHDVYSAFGGDIGIEQLREPVQTGTLDEFLAAVKADVTSKCAFEASCVCMS